MIVSVITLAALAAAQSAVPAQLAPATRTTTTAPAASQAVILAPVAGDVMRAGTEVPLVMSEGLDSNNKALREGQQFRMTVANDVRLGTAVVIPAGSVATGEITEVRRKGM